MTYVEFEDDADTVSEQGREDSESDNDTGHGDVADQSRWLLEREHRVLYHLNTQCHTHLGK